MKKVVKLTENDLARIVKRVIRENEAETKESIGWGHPNEGHVTIDITGRGDIKEVVVDKIIDTFRHYQGKIDIIIDGKKYKKFPSVDDMADDKGPRFY